MHRNKINDKVYIGQTNQKPERRWRNGEGYKDSPKFYNAIQKYGWNNFEHIILEIGNNQNWANEREQYWINFYDSFNNDFKGYNMTPGGNNYMTQLWTDEDFRQKMRKSFQLARKKSWKNKQFAQKQLNSLLSGIHKSWNNPEWKRQRINDLMGSKNPNSKAVKNIETGKIFNTIKEAAMWCGLNSISGIGQCCRGKQNTSGKHPKTGIPLHWMYVNDNTKEQTILKRTVNKRKRQVVCLNDNTIFESLSEASRWCGLKDAGHSIRACCENKQKTAGYHPVTKERCTWQFIGGDI